MEFISLDLPRVAVDYMYLKSGYRIHFWHGFPTYGTRSNPQREVAHARSQLHSMAASARPGEAGIMMVGGSGCQVVAAVQPDKNASAES